MGTLILNGTNTFTGGVNINGGTVQFAIPAAMPASGLISFGGGAIQYVAANLNDYSNRFSTAANQTYGIDTNGQNVTWASPMISVGGSFTKLGIGTVTLTSTNSYSAGTNLNGGTLLLGSSGAIGSTGTISFGGGTIQHSSVNNTDYSSRFSNSSNQAFSIDTNGQSISWATGLTSVGGSLAKFGAGALTMTGANAYSGNTTITAGTLRLNRTDTRTYVGDMLGSGTLDQFGSGTTILTGNTNVANVVITNGILQIGSGGTTGTLANNVLNSGSLRFNRSNAVTYSGVASGTGSFHQLGNGTLTLAAAQTYTGGTVISAGTILLGLTNALPVTGSVDLGAAGSLNLATFNQSVTTLNNNGFITVNGGTLTANVVTGNGSITLNGGLLTINSGSYSGTILGSGVGAGVLTKNGSGTLSLSSANTYTGGTVINQGTLQVSQDAALGSGVITFTPFASPVYSANSTTSRVLNLNFGRLTTTSAAVLTLSNALVGGGTLSGNFATQAGASSLLTSVNLATSAQLNLLASDFLSNSTNNGQVTIAASNIKATLDAVTNGSAGRITLLSGAGSANLNVRDFISNGLTTLGDGPTELNPNLLTNIGSTEMNFGGGSRTFIGTPATANQFRATMDLNGRDAVVAGGLFVNNGAVYDGTSGTAKIIADYGAVVKGAGYWSTTPITRNGGVFQTGNSPGIATTGSTSLSGPLGGQTSNINFQINNAAGTAGPTPDANNQVSGWSLLQVQRRTGSPVALQSNGNLTWSATSSDKLTINLQTLLNPTTIGNDIAGPMANFDPNLPASWLFIRQVNVTTPGGPLGTYTGPTDNATLTGSVNFVLSGFLNTIPSTATFGINFLDNSTATIASREFYITYNPNLQPVPEPMSLIIAGATAVGLWSIRKLKKQTK